MYRTRYQSQICEIIRPKYSVEVKKVTYEEWLKFMQKYQDERAKEEVPNDPDSWQKKSYDFIKDHKISDGQRPHSFVTRVEVWGMLMKFWEVLTAYLKK